VTKVLISGGGTGGHVFPAIAIANALKRKKSNIELLFVGANDRMEMEKVPAAGFDIIGLWISGFQRRLSFKNLSFPFKLLHSMVKAWSIIRTFKPHVVVGVGGYASGPILKVASIKGIPTLIQEQNSYPGITNRLLAKKVDIICVAYDGMEKFFPKDNILLTGNPVRKDILNLNGKKILGISHFGLDQNLKTILVVGGSLGALSINKGILKNLDLFMENEIQLIWQTGEGYYRNAKQEASKPRYMDRIKVYDFISHMDFAYSSADLIISRAGAIAISELACVGKAVIMVPSPYVAEDHQTKNAQAMIEKEAALLVKDGETVEKLGKTAIDLLNDQQKMEKMGENLKSLAKFESAELIADEVLKMAE